jgi:hypothetical protein
MSEVQVFRSSRLQGIAAVVFLALLSFGSAFLASGRPLLGWSLALLFGASAVVCLVGMLSGGSELRIGRKGFEIDTLFKRMRFRWDEIEPAELAQLRKVKVLAISYLPGSGKTGVARALTGMDATIPNAFGVPLQELRDLLNERRSRYLSSHSSAAPQALADRMPAAPSPAPAAAPVKAPRPVLLALGAAFLVLLLNVLLRLAFKLQGTGVTVGIAFFTGGMVMTWFLHFARRAPSAQERSRFLWAYAGLIIVPYAGLFALGAGSHGFNVFALVILAVQVLAYLGAAQFMLAEKRFAGLRTRTA